jgi:hypothetical protein
MAKSAFLFCEEIPMSPQITVAPATSQKRVDANRRNAQRSTGPRTPEGKSRSRFNGLKHGLTAAVPVIPGEDPAVYQARLEAMIESLPPRNQVELDLLGRVAATTWSLERATRAEAAQISQRIKDETIERQRREEDEAIALGQRLFWDARGPWQAYPHKPQTGNKNDTLTSRPQDPADPNTPALQIARLERTVAGCRWLLDRWAELRARLEAGEVWTAPDQFKAIRLLGKQPLDAIDDPEVTLICLACAKISPDGKGADAFATIKNELRDTGLASLKDEYSAYSKELRKRSFANLQPPDAGAAREALRALIDRQTARLKLILARNQEVADARAADAPDRLAFDPSTEGEKLRRYLLSAARLANQTIKTFLSVVRCPLSVAAGKRNAGLENEEGDIAAREWENGNPFADFGELSRAEPKATIDAPEIGEAAETGTAFAQGEAAISAGEASPHGLQTEPNVHFSALRCNPPALQAGENHSYNVGTQGFSLGCTPPAIQAEDSYSPACKADGFQPRVQPWEFEPIPHDLAGTPCSRPEGPEGPCLDDGQQPAQHQNARSSRMPPTFSNPEPLRHSGPAPLRTEPNTPPAQPEPGPSDLRTSGSPNPPRPDGEWVPERNPSSVLRTSSPPGEKGRVRGSEAGPDAPPTPAPLRTEPHTPPAPTFDSEPLFPAETCGPAAELPVTNVEPRSARDRSFPEQTTTEDSFAEPRPTLVDPHSPRDRSLPKQKTTEDSFAERRPTLVEPRSARDRSLPKQKTTEDSFAERRPTMVKPRSAGDRVPDGVPASELARLNMYRAVLHSVISPNARPNKTSSKRTEPNNQDRSRSRKPAEKRREN